MTKRLILIPAWNEEANLPGVLKSVAREAEGFDVLVVDDGSDDATSRIAVENGAQAIRHPFNLGYGASLQTGYKYALRHGVELVVQMDADGQHRAEDVTRLCGPVLEDRLDLVIGSRFLEPTAYEFGAIRGTGRSLFGGIARYFGLRITDPTSGFQALNRRVLRLYSGESFPSDFPDVDVLLAAHRAGIRIGEVSVEMREAPRTSTLHSGLRPIYYVYKMLLSIWANAERPEPPRDG